MKICTIIGARPQFIKASVFSSEIQSINDIEEVIIHTGQHYDEKMSQIFFQELNIPKEKYNLQVGSGSHSVQTSSMLVKIEDILLNEKPHWVLLYGDTNSTLAGGLAASKLNIPIAHVEAGMRSFNRKMPEEINRVITDHVSTLNFCSTITALENLKNEGLEHTSHLVGDIMYDCVLKFTSVAEKIFGNSLIDEYCLKKGEYILLTCHRAENTDVLANLYQIVEAINEIAKDHTIIFPIHPRTKKKIEENNLELSKNILRVKPLSYLEMIILEKNSKLIVTDSGGMQKEAFFHKIPCITLREETEWEETVKLGCNLLVGSQQSKILQAIKVMSAKSLQVIKDIFPYGDGSTSKKIIAHLKKYM